MGVCGIQHKAMYSSLSFKTINDQHISIAILSENIKLDLHKQKDLKFRFTHTKYDDDNKQISSNIEVERVIASGRVNEPDYILNMASVMLNAADFDLNFEEIHISDDDVSRFEEAYNEWLDTFRSNKSLTNVTQTSDQGNQGIMIRSNGTITFDGPVNLSQTLTVINE